jgi:hypothetical protein
VLTNNVRFSRTVYLRLNGQIVEVPLDADSIASVEIE